MNLIKVFLSVLLVFVGVSLVQAQSSAQLKKQRERINREIQELDNSLRTTSSERSLTLKQVNALNTQLRLREQKISTINSEISLLNNQIASHNKTIQNLRSQLEKLRKDYESMIMFAFRNQNAHNKMMFIFASTDFNQAFKRVKYLQQFNESRKKRAAEIEGTQKEIALKVAQLEASKKEQASLLMEQQNERKIIAQEHGAESKVLRSLTTQEKQFQEELTKKQQEDRRLARAIETAIKREIEEERKREEAARKAAAELEAARTGKTVKEVEDAKPVVRKTDNEVLSSASPEAAKLTADFAGNRGRLPKPVDGIVTIGFGRHTTGRNVIQESNGLTYQTREGAAVKAVFDGEVRMVTVSPGSGYMILVKHGKYFTVYQNIKSPLVKRGQQVSTSQTLGTAITDTDAGVTEMHFELWEGTTPINPASWLSN